MVLRAYDDRKIQSPMIQFVTYINQGFRIIRRLRDHVSRVRHARHKKLACTRAGGAQGELEWEKTSDRIVLTIHGDEVRERGDITQGPPVLRSKVVFREHLGFPLSKQRAAWILCRIGCRKDDPRRRVFHRDRKISAHHVEVWSFLYSTGLTLPSLASVRPVEAVQAFRVDGLNVYGCKGLERCQRIARALRFVDNVLGWEGYIRD